MGINLYEHQLDAVKKMKKGCILCGGVGSGKSLTSLAYYFFHEGGIYNRGYIMDMPDPSDLYIITTARKRDTFEWEGEMAHFLLSTKPEINHYKNKVVVDSWNNIKKYQDVKNAFFIFDEQRVVGSGAWVKSFLKIAKSNHWILLSATPGDTWSDYIPVFIANGFYKNRTQFNTEHVVYSRFSKFPKVERYLNTGKLTKQRNDILVNMDFKRKTYAHHIDVYVEHDAIAYKQLMKDRVNPVTGMPIMNASELCYQLRRIANTHHSRIEKVKDIVAEKRKVIIFYNFDYELDILKNADYGSNVEVAEWNGHCHQGVPKTKRWVYLVQYTAGAEGWNCTDTDTIIFYSQNYSYKVMVQSSGRIDRLNTPYTNLYYYHLKTHANIEHAIAKALKEKKNFNEKGFAERSK